MSAYTFDAKTPDSTSGDKDSSPQACDHLLEHRQSVLHNTHLPTTCAITNATIRHIKDVRLLFTLTDDGRIRSAVVHTHAFDLLLAGRQPEITYEINRDK